MPWGEDYRETEPYSKGKVGRLYLALSRRGDVSLPVSAELGRPEHLEFRWVPLERAKEVLPPRFWWILQWAQVKVSSEGV
ncbi:NUDIX hydrolase (fragment) [Cupriavidus taiwanensis]|uniref:NUDIX hydrolase n=1 Tax=Cupriavidus taiwanensis TaxID=164546 RepID=A0A375EE39_9BURK